MNQIAAQNSGKQRLSFCRFFFLWEWYFTRVPSLWHSPIYHFYVSIPTVTAVERQALEHYQRVQMLSEHRIAHIFGQPLMQPIRSLTPFHSEGWLCASGMGH